MVSCRDSTMLGTVYNLPFLLLGLNILYSSKGTFREAIKGNRLAARKTEEAV